MTQIKAKFDAATLTPTKQKGSRVVSDVPTAIVPAKEIPSPQPSQTYFTNLVPVKIGTGVKDLVNGYGIFAGFKVSEPIGALTFWPVRLPKTLSRLTLVAEMTDLLDIDDEGRVDAAACAIWIDGDGEHHTKFTVAHNVTGGKTIRIDLDLDLVDTSSVLPIALRIQLVTPAKGSDEGFAPVLVRGVWLEVETP